MQVTVSQQEGRVPVMVVQPHGDVDASNYTELIDQVRKSYAAGARDFLIDLSEVPFMSSAGLVALHSIAMFLRGEPLAGSQPGPGTLKSIDRTRTAGLQPHIKLLKPQPFVAETLDKAGFTQSFEVHSDLGKAIASF